MKDQNSDKLLGPCVALPPISPAAEEAVSPEEEEALLLWLPLSLDPRDKDVLDETLKNEIRVGEKTETET